MKLFFGNTLTTLTALIILVLPGFVGYSVYNKASISYWGRRSAFLLVFWLVICCLAAARDGLDKTILHTISPVRQAASNAGSARRNHCPTCLSSLHVDFEPGDRASDCSSIMEPASVRVCKGGKLAIIHRCRLNR